MASLNIVIVTYNWPPRNAIGTHRPYSWARCWSEAGAQVTVLTAQKQAFDHPLDLALPVLKGVDVIEVPYGGAGGNLVARILESQRVRRWVKRVNNWLSRKGAGGINRRDAWRQAAEEKVLQLASKADIVVSTFGPAAAHLIACELKTSNPNVFWVADYRDLWSQSHMSGVTKRALAGMREMELASVGRHADLLTAVSDDMVRQLGDLTGKTVLKVPNGFDIDEDQVRQMLRTSQKKPDGALRIVYTGMIYKRYRDPKPLLDVLAGLYSAGKLDAGSVTVDFYGSRVEVAEELARNRLYAPFVRLMGHVSREGALAAQREAGLLLLLESSAPEARGVLTGKLFEYIVAGRPILCVGSKPEYEIGQVLRATGTGKVFGSDGYTKIGEAILETVDGSGLYRSYCPNIEEILRFSRKRTAAAMLDVLQRQIATS